MNYLKCAQKKVEKIRLGPSFRLLLSCFHPNLPLTNSFHKQNQIAKDSPARIHPDQNAFSQNPPACFCLLPGAIGSGSSPRQWWPGTKAAKNLLTKRSHGWRSDKPQQSMHRKLEQLIPRPSTLYKTAQL